MDDNVAPTINGVKEYILELKYMAWKTDIPPKLRIIEIII